jgi:hypothetical protein
MATWLSRNQVHTGSAHQVQQVQEKAGESGRHESRQEQERGEEQGADAAGAPARKKEGAAAGARHERWMAALRKVLPSSSDKIKVERRKQAGLETLAVRRLAAPGARLLKEPAKVEAVACLLHSEVRARFEACVLLLASAAGCASLGAGCVAFTMPVLCWCSMLPAMRAMKVHRTRAWDGWGWWPRQQARR